MYDILFDTLFDTFLFSHKTKSTRNTANKAFLVLSTPGDEGIEPPPKVLETPIIPFDQSPIFNSGSKSATRYLYHKWPTLVKFI